MRTFRTPFLAVLLFYLFLKPVFAGDLAYAVQVGAFVKENNALALTDKLTKAGYRVTVREEPAAEGERTLRKVLVGPYETRSEAMRAGRDLHRRGFAAGHPILRVLPTPEAGVEKPRELAQARTAATDVSPAETVKAEPKPPAAPSPPSTGGIEAALREGIRQYRDENYEEAIEVLAQARRQDPKSSTAAFFLGLAYKQTNDLTQAAAQMRDAVTLTPPIREAVIELIDLLNQLDQVEEAMKWVAVAERDGLFPAKTAFLKGLLLTKQRRFDEAVVAFEKSKELEKGYTQAADLQIGLAYLQNRKFTKARERFQASITQDPLSDLASYARRYQDIVEEQSFLQRPLRITLGVSGQYDTNMLQEPTTFPGLPDSGEERTMLLNSSLRLDYVPILPGNWLFNASAGVVNKLHEKNSTRYDLFANTFSVAPGYNAGRFAFNLLGNYTHVLKRGDYENQGGGYRRYSENFSVGPQVRFLAAPNHILEVFAGYQKKNYFKTTPPGSPQEDMSAGGFDGYLGWMWIFANGGLLNTRAGMTVDNADGLYWNARNYKLSLNLFQPLWPNKVNLQLGGEYSLVTYTAENANFNSVIRLDQIYTGIVGINWNINRHVTALLQYTGIVANSNIFIYDYSRSIWSAGLEFRF